jgi:hypothetical protein
MSRNRTIPAQYPRCPITVLDSSGDRHQLLRPPLSQMTLRLANRIVKLCDASLSYHSAKRWVAPAVQRGFINPGKRQISVPGGGSTLTHHQAFSEASSCTHLSGNRQTGQLAPGAHFCSYGVCQASDRAPGLWEKQARKGIGSKQERAGETGSPARPCFAIDYWSASTFFSVGFGTCQRIWESLALCG